MLGTTTPHASIYLYYSPSKITVLYTYEKVSFDYGNDFSFQSLAKAWIYRQQYFADFKEITSDWFYQLPWSFGGKILDNRFSHWEWYFTHIMEQVTDLLTVKCLLIFWAIL